MNIGIIGNGVVGGILVDWLTGIGYRSECQLYVYDINPKKRVHSLDLVLKCDTIFVCIYLHDNAAAGGYYVLRDYIKLTNPGATVVIRTTVIPGTCSKLQAECLNRTILYCPEFLTEANAQWDFENPWIQVIGGSGSKAADVSLLLPIAPKTYIFDHHQAEVLKLAIAGYLATKVSWFNQLYDALGPGDFSAVREMMIQDPRIGRTHTDIGQDGYRGWAGKCFTKDVPMFSNVTEMPIMKEVTRYNQGVRKWSGAKC